MSYTCPICDSKESWAWTDTHGVAQCYTCGAPHVIFHYEGEGDARQRVEKPPALCIKEEFVPLCRQYWAEKHMRIPGGHSFPGGQELTTPEEQRAFYDFLAKRKTENSSDRRTSQEK